MGVSDRRWMLKTLGLAPFYPAMQLRYPKPVTDKEALIALLDRAQIDLDATKTEVTLKVNGREVIGTEGGQVIFKFGARGQLTQVVVWNSGISDQKETG